MSLGATKRRQRETQRRDEFDRRVRVPDTPLTCLKCRRCRVTRVTDFTAAVPRIYCEKSERLRPIVLDGCAIADPRPARPKRLHHLWVGTKRNHGDLGDRSRASTPALRLYLDLHWTTGDAATLQRHTGRTMAQLRAIVLRYGIGGVARGRSRTRLSGRVAGKHFTVQQTAWLERAYANDAIWPRVATYNMSQGQREIIQVRREWIMGQVAERGPSFTWTQILRHLTKRRSRENAKRRVHDGQ